ncbi:MAG: hypothetical protein RLZZ419_1080 [Pseudomonadota bacterium]|jgi:hypothetical protein
MLHNPEITKKNNQVKQYLFVVQYFVKIDIRQIAGLSIKSQRCALRLKMRQYIRANT